MLFLWINYLLVVLAAATEGMISNKINSTRRKCHNVLDNSNAYWSQLEQKVETSKQMRFSPKLQAIKLDLLLALNQAFPNQTTSIHFFGSRVAGVGNECSDLDIFANIDSIPKDNPFEIARQQLYKAADVLHRTKNITWKSVNTIVNTVVPIISLTHIPSNISVDINFSRKASAANDQLANYMFDLQPIGRYMVHYLRDRAKRLELSSELRSHHHTLMVIYFLQMKHLLPSVHYLQNKLKPDFAPVTSKFNKLSHLELELKRVDINPTNTDILLQEYLKFYQNFDYDKYIISPYHGSWVPRSKLVSLMPKGYNIAIRNWITPVVIQHMIYLNLNNAKALKLQHLNRFLPSSEQLDVMD